MLRDGFTGGRVVVLARSWWPCLPPGACLRGSWWPRGLTIVGKNGTIGGEKRAAGVPLRVCLRG